MNLYIFILVVIIIAIIFTFGFPEKNKDNFSDSCMDNCNKNYTDCESTWNDNGILCALNCEDARCETDCYINADEYANMYCPGPQQNCCNSCGGYVSTSGSSLINSVCVPCNCSCPNNCNGRGTCPSQLCNYDGTCKSGITCSCTNGWSGNDCSLCDIANNTLYNKECYSNSQTTLLNNYTKQLSSLASNLSSISNSTCVKKTDRDDFNSITLNINSIITSTNSPLPTSVDDFNKVFQENHNIFGLLATLPLC